MNIFYHKVMTSYELQDSFQNETYISPVIHRASYLQVDALGEPAYQVIYIEECIV